MISRRNLFWLLLAGSLTLPQSLAYAEDGDGDGGRDDDQDRALKAVKNDRAATLKEILAIVRKKYDGEIVRVSLRGSGANLTYRIKLLDEDNRLIEVLVNAVSRRIVRAKGT